MILAAGILLLSLAAAFAQPAPPLFVRTNWFFFAATSVSSNGWESVYSNEISTNRHRSNLWSTLTFAWNPSPSPDVVGYRIYYGKQSQNYTQIFGLFTGTTATIRIIPPPPSNWVISVSTIGATNLMASDRITGPWVQLNKTNWIGTNPHAPQFWRAVGGTPAPDVFVAVTNF